MVEVQGAPSFRARRHRGPPRRYPEATRSSRCDKRYPRRPPRMRSVALGTKVTLAIPQVDLPLAIIGKSAAKPDSAAVGRRTASHRCRRTPRASAVRCRRRSDTPGVSDLKPIRHDQLHDACTFIHQQAPASGVPLLGPEHWDDMQTSWTTTWSPERLSP